MLLRQVAPRIGGPGVELDRRAVLGLAGVAAGLAGMPPTLARAAINPPLRYVLTDGRYEESLQFGEALVRQGSIRLELTEGLTRLWWDVLAPHWRSRPGAVAALTPPGAWHVLSEQARSDARKSALIGRHLVAPHAAAAHVVTAPHAALAATGGLNARGWPAAMAGLAARCAPAPHRCDGEWRSEPRSNPRDLSYSLFTWIIA